VIPYVLVYCDSLYSYVGITKLEKIIMETSLALTIIGIVLTLVGIIFNAIPKVVRQLRYALQLEVFRLQLE